MPQIFLQHLRYKYTLFPDQSAYVCTDDNKNIYVWVNAAKFTGKDLAGVF